MKPHGDQLLAAMPVPKAFFSWRFLLPHLWPDAVTGVYLAEPIADTIAVCIAAPMFYRYCSKLK